MMISRCRFVLAAALLLLVPQIAAAEEPVETALREKVAAIDASPDWSASFGRLTYDSITDTATLSDFVARTERPGTEIAIASIAVSGYKASPDGSFNVKSVVADGGVLKIGFATVSINDVGIEDLFVPVMDDVVLPQNKPFTSMIKLYGQALKSRFSQARAGSIEIAQHIEGVDSKITYEHLRMLGFSDGKLATVRAGPVRMDSPSSQGLVSTTIGSIEGSDTDLAAFVQVYDPDNYVNGVGDMVWHDGIGLVAYHDIQMDVPGARIKIDGIAVENARVRQPPVPFAPFLDAVMLNPGMSQALLQRLSVRHLSGLLGAWSFGRIGVTGLSIEAAGIDRMAFQSFEMTDLSIDGLGEFAIEGFEAAVRGQFAMRLGRFAIGGIPFGGIDGLNRLAASLDSGKDIDPTSVVPSIGFLELADLDVQTPDIDRLSLARIRLDTSDYVGLVPSATTFEMSGLVVPTNAITDRQARALMERFGYEKIDLNFFAEAAWKPAGQVLTVKDLRFSLKDMGGMAMNFAIGGFPLPALQDDKALQAALPGMTFLNGELTFQDESIIGNGLDMLAEQMHARPDAFRQQFADAIPFFLSMATANDPQLLALIQRSGLLPKLIPVVRDFVAVPGSSITFSAKPLTPVGVMAIAQAAESAPSTLADLLGLTITGKRGEVAPPPEEENKVEPPPPAPPTQSPGAAQQPAQ